MTVDAYVTRFTNPTPEGGISERERERDTKPPTKLEG